MVARERVQATPREAPAIVGVTLALLSAIALTPLAAAAQEPEPTEHEHRFSNEAGIFLGDTHKDGNDAFTIGLDYQHRLSPVIGAGLLVEWASNDKESEFVLGVPLFLHPPGAGGLEFVAAPAVELVEEEEKDGDGEHSERGDEEEEEEETFFLLRLGVEYGLEVGRLVIAPGVFWDIVEGPDALVYGAAMGVAF
jgi:hypothetical protein